MSWATAKARIKVVLEGISTVKRVYENPPNTIQDPPCFVIYPPAVEIDRRPGGWRKKDYTVRLRCVASDQDWASAAGALDTLREATIDAFDLDTRLDQNATIITGPRCEEAVQIQFGDRPFLGFDALLTVRLDDDTVYGL